MRIFHRGGNAVDAGVATMFAASVAEYSHFGFGGEAPFLSRQRRQSLCDCRCGTMPKMATPDFSAAGGFWLVSFSRWNLAG